ncbi:MAG: hypothetical protein AB7T09_37445 [Planctomycetota bacterium]
MSKEPLSAAQLAALRRGQRRDPAELARELGLPRNRVDEELALLEQAFPVWEGREPRWGLLLGALLILTLGWFAYGGNQGYGLHFDDTHTVLDAERVPTLRRYMRDQVRADDPPLRKLGELRRGLIKSTEAIFRWNPFRVVTYTTFAVQDWLNDGLQIPSADHPQDPFLKLAKPEVHRFNDRVHLLNGLLALWVAYLVLTSPALRRSLAAGRFPVLGAILVGVWFTLHPLQTQAVTYISQRAESMAATFYLLALGLYITARERARGPQAGSAPWITPLVWAGAGALAGALVILARWEKVSVVTGLYLGLGLLFAAVAASALLVSQGRDERWHAAATGGCFVAFGIGLETKEIVATLPLAIVAWELLLGHAPAPDAAPRGGPWLLRAGRALALDRGRARYSAPWLVAVFAAGLGVLALGGGKVTELIQGKYVRLGGRQQVPLDPGTYLLTQANVLQTYGRLAALPYGQNLDHDYPLARMPQVEEGYAKPPVSSAGTTLLSLALLAGVVGLALWRGGRARVPAFALAMALVVLLPSSSVVVLSDVIYEHRCYLPMFAAGLVLAVALERALRLAPERARAPAFAGAILLLAVTGAALTRARNEVWKNDLTLWSDVVSKSPNKPRGLLNLALEYQNRETDLVALSDGNSEYCHLRPLPCRPNDPKVLMVNVSKMTEHPRVLTPRELVGHQRTGYTQEQAEELLGRVLAIEPSHSKSLNNLAIIYSYRRHNVRAEQEVLQTQLVPEYRRRKDEALVNACIQRYEELERESDELSDKALECYLIQVAHQQSGFHLHNNLGNVYLLRYDYPNAAENLRTAVRYEEAPAEVWAVLGECCSAWGEWTTLYGQQSGDRYPGGPAAAGQAARAQWEEARRCLNTFLVRQHDSPFTGRVRASLSKVEGYLNGSARVEPRRFPKRYRLWEGAP